MVHVLNSPKWLSSPQSASPRFSDRIRAGRVFVRSGLATVSDTTTGDPKNTDNTNLTTLKSRVFSKLDVNCIVSDNPGVGCQAPFSGPKGCQSDSTPRSLPLTARGSPQPKPSSAPFNPLIHDFKLHPDVVEFFVNPGV